MTTAQLKLALETKTVFVCLFLYQAVNMLILL